MRSPFILLFLVLSPFPTFALSTDAQQAVELEADSVEIDDTKGFSTYRGNVDIKQGSIHLRSDKLTVYHANRKVNKFIAEGRPVHFEQLPDNSKTPTKATAKKAEYFLIKQELILTGNAVISQGKDVFRSDRIIYDSKNAKVKAGKAAAGKQRVKITIQPGTASK